MERQWDAVIVGAGVSGALVARRLTDAGWRVLVLDKGRGPGGRTSTRRTPEHAFDHGAQYATFRSEELQPEKDSWVEKGWLAEWKGPFFLHDEEGMREVVPRTMRYVGQPGMNALVSGLLEGVTVSYGEEVTHVEDLGEQGVRFRSARGTTYQGIRACFTLPATQLADLMEHHSPLQRELGKVRYAPCLAAMVTFDEPTTQSFGAVSCNGEKVAWVARNQTKPGRPPGEQWVVHANPGWSHEHIDRSKEWIADELHRSLQQMFPGLPPASIVMGHRWKYALVEQSVGRPFLQDGNLFVCGDGMLGGKVESALLSGAALCQEWLGMDASSQG